MKITRRTLLHAAAACGCTSLLRGLLGPTLSYASSPAGGGNGDNLVLIVLNGGHDGLFMFEPVHPQLRSVLMQRRPWLMRDTALITNFGDDTFGLDAEFGVNPSSTPSVPASVRDLLVSGEAKILSCFGHIHSDGAPINFRSHPQALNWLMAGAEYTHGNQWIQRLMESGEFSPYQTFRLGDCPGLPYLAGNGHAPPISLPAGLSEYDYDQPGMRAAAKVLVDVLNLESNLSPSAENVRLAMLGMDSSVPVVKLIPPTPLSGAYSGDASMLFADAARILKRRAQGRTNPQDPFHDSGKAVIQIGLGGFDMHSDVLYALPNRIRSLNACLTALRNDLAATPSGTGGQSVWDRTTVVICSEFGRSLFAPGIGSEHGHGNVSLVAGGSLSGSSDVVLGTRPTAAELALPDPNSAQGDFRGVPVHHDYRDVFWEIIEWMGMNPAPVFPGFQPRRLGFLGGSAGL